MDDAAKALLLQRRELSKQMQTVEPGSADMESLLDQEAEVVRRIRAIGLDLGNAQTAYGIAYGVLADGSSDAAG